MKALVLAGRSGTATRDRVHDLGAFKAVRMTPRQTIAMVICWVIGPAVAAAIIAVPAGMYPHSVVVRAMAISAGTGVSPSYVTVYRYLEVLLLALSGLVIAVLGAIAPASWQHDPNRSTARDRAEGAVNP